MVMKTRTLFNPTGPQELLQACPAYTASPLWDGSLRGRRLLVKDETNRMGLGAFKALGGVYAVAQLIARMSLSPPRIF
jgi:diaminopropionate ammonia-lyase